MDDGFRPHRAALLKVFEARERLKEDNIPCKIEEGLYLGSVRAPTIRNTLKNLNITHILSITSSMTSTRPEHFVCKTIQVQDRSDVNISQYFDECFTFIDEARARGGGVLVHCFAGRSRSVTVLVAYLMFKNGSSLSEAMQHVKLNRPVASPNPGFMLHLHEYERSLQGPVVPDSSIALDGSLGIHCSADSLVCLYQLGLSIYDVAVCDTLGLSHYKSRSW
ncbi:hypothetical protein OROGR_014282 [Orobanche gracilis]